MKVKLSNRDDGDTSIYLEAENAQENIELLKLAKRTKKPNKAKGQFTDQGLLWIWMDLPSKKISDYQILQIAST